MAERADVGQIPVEAKQANDEASRLPQRHADLGP
jgi:hypothetical protein